MVLDKLLKKCKKYITFDIPNINYTISKIKTQDDINLIETNFISNKIRDYINDNIKYKYIIDYLYKNKCIHIEFYTKKEIKTKIFKVILRRIIFMMEMSNTITNINITIFNIPLKKQLNCKYLKKCGKKLTEDNVNSGVNWSNNIVLFRGEELLKVLVHEIIHALDIDCKYEIDMYKNKLLKLFCINKKEVLLNESYVETWALLLHSFLSLYENNDMNLQSFKKVLKTQTYLALIQSSKLLLFYGINDIKDLYVNKDDKCNKLFDDNVNTFSYHICKTINLLNMQAFIKKFGARTYIMNKRYNYKKYIDFLIVNNISLLKPINQVIKKINKKKYNLSLRMSL